MKKRVWSLVLVLALCLSMMPTATWADVEHTGGASVAYDGDAQDDQGIAVQLAGIEYINGIKNYYEYGEPNWSTEIIDDYTLLESGSGDTALTAGYHVVSPGKKVTIDGDVTLEAAGDTYIILCQGASLTIKGSVTIPGGHGLHIYGTSSGSTVPMTVTNPDGCAFKSADFSNPAYVYMNGCVLTATGKERALENGVYLKSGDGSDYQMSIKCTNNDTGEKVKASGTEGEYWCSNEGDHDFSAGSFTLESCDHPGDAWMCQKATVNTHSETCSLCGYRKGGPGYTVGCYFDITDKFIIEEGGHKAICECGNVDTLKEHVFDSVATDDGKGHTSRCGKCLYTQAGSSVTLHTYNENGECKDCYFKPLASDSNGNLYEYINDALQAVADGTADWVQLDSKADGDKFVRDSISFDAVGKTVTLKMNGQRLESTGVALTVNSGTLTIPDVAVIQNTGINEMAAVGVRLCAGTLVFSNGLTAQGGYNSDGRKPAVNAGGGTFDLQGDLKLNGGLTLTGSAQLQNKLTQGTFYIGNSTNGSLLNGKTVSVEGSTEYTYVCDLLADGYAFAKCDVDGNLVDADGKETTEPVLVAGNVRLITENVKIVAHQHSWNNAKCDCGVECEHIGTGWKDGKCRVCGYACEHKFGVNTDNRCKTCLYQMAVQINGTTYIPQRMNNGYDESLSEALGRAQDGDKLTLLVDGMSAYSGKYSITSKSVTIDFNGKQLIENLGVSVRENGTLTITGTGGSKDSSNNEDSIVRSYTILIGKNGKLVTENWNGTLNNLRIDAKNAKAELDGGAFNSIEASLTNFTDGSTDKADFTMGSLLKAGYAFQYTSDSEDAGEYVAYAKRLAYGVNDVDATISNVQVVKCPHTKIGDDGHCAYCDATGFKATVTKNGVTNVYTDLSTAVSEADGGIVKLLADATDSVTVSSALTLDLNGKNVTSLTVSAKATIIDLAATKGTITTLTTSNGVTLGDLCEQGFGFKSTASVWSDEFATSASNVRIVETPIKSVTINGETAGLVVTKTYGQSGVVLTGDVKWVGNNIGQKWYQVEDSKVTEISGAGSLTYELSTYLPVGTYTYRLTIIADGCSKSCDATVIVEAADIKDADIGVSNDLVFTPDADGNGTQITANVTVNRGSKGLTEGTDYTVTGNRQTNAGSYELTIIGTGNYTGTKTVGWEIKKNTVEVENIADMIKTYDGTTDLPDGFALGFFKSEDGYRTGVYEVSLTEGKDYTMTGHYNSAEVGSDKTVRLQLTMLNPNYLFDNGQTTRELVVNKTFFKNTNVAINQAAMPAFDKTMSLTVANNMELTYTTGLPALPKLAETCKYGEVTYEITGNTLDSRYYTDGASVNSDGILTLPIKAVDTVEEKVLGTITVTVKTTNYADAVLTVNVSAVNKIVPQMQSIDVSTITYGDPLSKAVFKTFTFVEPSNTSNRIAGTLAWQNPDKLLEVGTHQEEWVFTPTDADKYLSVTGTVEVTVVPAASTGGGSVGGGGSAIPAEDSDVVTVKDGKGASTQIITKTTVKDVKTETVKNAQGQDVLKTRASVSQKLADELINQAVANKSHIVEITVKSDNGSSAPAGGVRSTELEFPKAIAENTNADLVIKTDSGQVVIDNKTLKTIASKAKGDTVKISVNENVRLTEAQKAAGAIGKNGKVYELAIQFGSKQLHSFGGGKVYITLPIPESLKDREICVIYIDDKGVCKILNHSMETIGADHYVRFSTSHFSTFAIVEKAKAEKMIEKQNLARVKTLIKNIRFKVKTTKIDKTNVKVQIAVKPDKNVISNIKAMGYTVKYRFYRSTKKSSGYKTLTTQNKDLIVSTKQKKGKKYYYKVKVLIYDGKKLVAQSTLKSLK